MNKSSLPHPLPALNSRRSSKQADERRARNLVDIRQSLQSYCENKQFPQAAVHAVWFEPRLLQELDSPDDSPKKETK
jgi:hypothetical protein